MKGNSQSNVNPDRLPRGTTSLIVGTAAKDTRTTAASINQLAFRWGMLVGLMTLTVNSWFDTIVSRAAAR
jgi:hypothetical protein